MRNFLSVRKRIFNQCESGFSLVEIIFVLAISIILLVIAVPKLEIPVRKLIDGFKNYSYAGFNSLRSSVDIIKRIYVNTRKIKHQVISLCS